MVGGEKGEMTSEWQKVGRPMRRVRPREPKVYVSINARGEIVLGAGAFRALGGGNVVILMYDAARRSIGIRWPNTREGDHFPVKRYGRGRRARIIRARPLFERMGIKIAKTITFPEVRIEEYEKNPMLVVELDRAEELPRRAIREGG